MLKSIHNSFSVVGVVGGSVTQRMLRATEFRKLGVPCVYDFRDRSIKRQYDSLKKKCDTIHNVEQGISTVKSPQVVEGEVEKLYRKILLAGDWVFTKFDFDENDLDAIAILRAALETAVERDTVRTGHSHLLKGNDDAPTS